MGLAAFSRHICWNGLTGSAGRFERFTPDKRDSDSGARLESVSMFEVDFHRPLFGPPNGHAWSAWVSAGLWRLCLRVRRLPAGKPRPLRAPAGSWQPAISAAHLSEGPFVLVHACARFGQASRRHVRQHQVLAKTWPSPRPSADRLQLAASSSTFTTRPASRLQQARQLTRS